VAAQAVVPPALRPPVPAVALRAAALQRVAAQRVQAQRLVAAVRQVRALEPSAPAQQREPSAQVPARRRIERAATGRSQRREPSREVRVWS
jgi:hypothetical protein